MSATQMPSTQQPDPNAGHGIEAVTPAPEYDFEDPQYYLNREFSWLEFNRRVLFEAENENNPQLERLKFVALVNSNLDEFFMKRIGGLKQQLGSRVRVLSVDGRTPEQQIVESYAIVNELEDRIRSIVPELIKLLADNEVYICSYNNLSVEEQSELREYYLNRGPLHEAHPGDAPRSSPAPR